MIFINGKERRILMKRITGITENDDLTVNDKNLSDITSEELANLVKN